MELKTVRDPAVLSLAERIAEHYQANIASRFIRPVLMQVGLEKPVWDLIDELTVRPERYREFAMDELYREIAALARFVAVVRRDLVPNLRNRVGTGGTSGQEKVVKDLAVATFPSNITVLADYLNQLFDILVKMDQADVRNGRKPMYPQMPELIDVKRNLGFAS
jgi:hypothetical protein